MPDELVTISQTKGWMKKTGSWFSDVWNYLANIQFLMQQQTQVQTRLNSIYNRIQAIANEQIPKVTRFTIHTVKIEKADTEYNQLLPDNTKLLTIEISDGTSFRMSFEPNRVAKANRPYATIPTNGEFDEHNLDLTGVTIYFASSTADKTIEIITGQ